MNPQDITQGEAQTEAQTEAQADTSTAAADPLEPLDRLAELAELAAQNPQVGAPLRELMPLLVAVVRQHAEMLTLLGA